MSMLPQLFCSMIHATNPNLFARRTQYGETGRTVLLNAIRNVPAVEAALQQLTDGIREALKP